MVRVLHVFYNFLPDVSGSSIRSAGILSGQTAVGFSVSAISSPFQPGFSSDAVDYLDGIHIYRTHRTGNPRISESGSRVSSRIRKLFLFPSFVQQVLRAARAENATVLHAHSTFFCGLAALIAGRILGVRVIYEFRSLWEERARSKGLVYRIQSKVATYLETFCLRAAGHVVAINQALRALVIARGVSPDRVSVVPNAVADSVLEEGRHMQSPETFSRFGYVGNLSRIEGLDYLVAAFTKAFPAQMRVTLSFHGAGPLDDEMRRLIASTGDARISINGAFKRNQLTEVYSGLDCVVIARRRSLLTETVTPLKPLEAMAFSRLVAASDVQGLVEVTGGPEHTRFFAADDVDALAAVLADIHQRPIPHRQIATAGNVFVCDRRAWSSIASRYHAIYASA